MEDWLTKACQLFPELREQIFEGHDYDSPMSLWIDLFYLLVCAYKKAPFDDDVIGRIYDYAAWCFEQPQTNDAETDLSSSAAVGLIEDIPLDENISGDLYRWMSTETFLGCENLFRYHLADEAYRTFREEFLRKKKTYPAPSRL